jgi:hypothetical protein
MDFALPVASQTAEGIANYTAGGDYGYRAVITARKDVLTVDYVFERVGFGPLPDNVRV